jgi:surface carbohydrate biosynthesis protein (TIGR04326 family)
VPDLSTRTVFLLPAEPSAIQGLKEAGTDETGCIWIYLGKSVRGSARVQQQLGSKYRRMFIGDRLQKAAQDARQEYIDYIGRLFLGSKSPIWFLSSLSEKNPYISRFLVHYAYVRVGTDMANTHTGDLAILCENAAVLSSLAKVLVAQTAFQVRILSSPQGTIASRRARTLRKAGRKCWFVIRFLLRILCSRLLHLVKRSLAQPSLGNRKWIVLHSWTDSRSFPVPGRFSSSYFGDIGNALDEKHHRLLYLADVLPSYWYPRAVFNLLRSGKNFALMEEFITIMDLFTALRIASENYPLPPEIPPFMDLDVSDIVLDELDQDRSDTRTEQTFLCSCVSRRLCPSLDIGLFLYAFENHTWEKMFCEAIRKSGCRATLAGYAGVVINPMYTCYSLSGHEKPHAPLPDTIFVSGEQGRLTLIRSGFDSRMIRVGGAIRYHDLLVKKAAVDHAAGTTILLALTGEINASLELISKAIEAFSGCPEIRVLIKCHPTIPYASISHHLPRLPGTFSVTTLPVGEILPKTGLVLYTESTVCVEAVAQGVPVLHVRSDHSIDINIFEGNPAIPSCSDPQDIRDRALPILQGTGVLPSPEIIYHLFQPADRESITRELISLCEK